MNVEMLIAVSEKLRRRSSAPFFEEPALKTLAGVSHYPAQRVRAPARGGDRNRAPHQYLFLAVKADDQNRDGRKNHQAGV